MKRLFICEKASLARTVADALNGTQKKDNGSIIVGDDVVTWSHGHILGFVFPEVYNEQYKEKWEKTVHLLPIMPDKWRYNVNDEETLKKIETLMRQCEKDGGQIVNVGDADREGQLLIDEIFMHYGLNLSATGSKVLRLYVTDPTVSGVKHSLEEMKQNADKQCRGSFNAANTRAKADWIVGMSGTRLFTATSNSKEYIGRVQTPTLALIVNRDLEIEHFVPKPFVVLQSIIDTANGKFIATWKPSSDWEGLDPEGKHIVNRDLLEKEKSELLGRTGRISKFTKKVETENQPLPFCLSSLQTAASKKYGFSAKHTLELLQSLYEKKITTYPRSDCMYLPTALFEERQKVIDGIFILFAELSTFKGHLEMSLKTKAWNDSKVTEHFGIVPTGATTGTLSQEERMLLEMICKRYLAQFIAPATYDVTEAEAEIAGEIFTARSKKIKSEGWQILKCASDEKETETDEDKDDNPNLYIPDLTVGLSAKITEFKEVTKQTTPPKRFTEGTIIDAMTNIQRYVTDEKLKKQLKEAEGIGTAATRAEIIEKLKERGEVEVKNKALVSTQGARERIAATPEDFTSPVMTAYWESCFKKIEQGEMTQEQFMTELKDWFLKIKAARLALHPVVEKKPYTNNKPFAPGAKRGGKGPTGKSCDCPACKAKDKCIQLRSGAGRLFWKCQNTSCGKIYSDAHGKPAATASGEPKRDMTHTKNFRSLR